MEAFLVSTGLVALAEIGDKTQLLAFLLAARFRKPVPIILGIFIATLVNHACAGAVGAWITAHVSADIMRWVLGAGFVAMGLWTLVPDKVDDEDASSHGLKLGVLGTTIVAFFLAVVAGTTLGMMIANVPAVLLGDRIAHKIPVRLVHGIAALIFIVLGALVLSGVGKDWGL